MRIRVKGQRLKPRLKASGHNVRLRGLKEAHHADSRRQTH